MSDSVIVRSEVSVTQPFVAYPPAIRAPTKPALDLPVHLCYNLCMPVTAYPSLSVRRRPGSPLLQGGIHIRVTFGHIHVTPCQNQVTKRHVFPTLPKAKSYKMLPRVTHFAETRLQSTCSTTVHPRPYSPVLASFLPQTQSRPAALSKLGGTSSGQFGAISWPHPCSPPCPFPIFVCLSRYRR